MILRLLNNPYPFIFNIYSVLVPSVVTFVLILFLKPLGFSSVEFLERALIALVISIIVGVSIYLGVRVIKLWVPNYMNEEQWTVGKEISLWLFVLFIITCSISLVFISLDLFQNEDETALSFRLFFHTFLDTAYITLGISIIPMLVLILFEQYNHQKKQHKEARQFSNLLEEQLQSNEKPDTEKDKILFTSENNDVELQVNPHDVIFIQSEGNYVEIYYVYDGLLNKKLIRHRLKVIEQQLPKAIFFRCHNRYVVNTKRITNVTGNARGLYLELENIEQVIPVSRSKVKGFKTLFDRR